MTMDKSWMNANRVTKEFLTGLKAFIEYAEQFVNSEGEIHCPCKRCRNVRLFKPKKVYAHIFDSGMQPDYTTWTYHGESRTRVRNPVVEELGDDMAPILNDFLDNEADELPIDNDSDDNIAELISKLHEDLYPGCKQSSTLKFTAELMHIKALFKWSNESVDVLFKKLNEILPEGSNFPKSFYEAKKLLNKLGLGYKKIHVCENDCALYWKENEKLEACPVCNTSRWKITNGKKVPHKVLRYFPLKPRLRRLYASRHTAKAMTWHRKGRSSDEDIMRHPVDGKEWKEFDMDYPDFAQEDRNVRLALATDGFNPFGNMSNSYSMWPVMSLILNLSPWDCNKDPYRHLTLLIPGPNSPGKDIDVYLQPLIEELQELWSEGINVCDASTDTTFKMRAALMFTINDFPARSYLSGWSGQGYKACPTCNVDTPAQRLTNKIGYVGHRRWLHVKHPMRKNIGFNGEIERRPPPAPKTTEEIVQQLQNLEPRLPGKHKSYGGKKRKRPECELNWAKRCSLWDLPYWRGKKLKHNLDVMHIEKNVFTNLSDTILDIPGKTKDTDKARIDLKNMNVRSELHLYEHGNRVMKPHAAYTMTQADGQKYCKFLQGVRFPDGFASNLKKNVIEANTSSKLTGLKSHDCHIILQRLLPIGVRKFLRKDIADSIIDLSNFFRMLCSRTLKVSEWLECVRRFRSDSFKEISERNTKNRKKVKYASLQGRTSQAQRRHESTANGTKPGDTDFDVFKQIDGEWVSHLAAADHARMLEEAQRELSSTPGASLTPEKQKEIMEKVLGRRRGYIPGIGPSIPSSSSSERSTAASSSGHVSKEEHDATRRHLHNLSTAFDTLLQWVKTALPDTPMPHINIPPPPPASPLASDGASHDVDIDDDFHDH